LPAAFTAALVSRAKAAIGMSLSHGGAAGAIVYSWPPWFLRTPSFPRKRKS